MKVRSIKAGTALLVIAASLSAAPSAQAQTNPYQRGPEPTEATVTATKGSFAYATTSVSSLSASGFGGGTIYYPTSTTSGTFGGVVITPGFTERQSDINWFGPRLASQGFVVFTIDTTSTLSQPDSRASQMLAAMDYLTKSSSVRTKVDPNRLAVMGHSMGGGGSLRATETRPSIKASIPFTPYHTDKTWGSVKVPTMIIAAENDLIAPAGSHASPFYNSLSSSLDKAYLEMNNGSHSVANSANTTVAKYSISWLKRFVDNDTRYSKFLCGPNHTANSAISDYRSSCPYDAAAPAPAPTTTTTVKPTTTTTVKPTTTTTVKPTTTTTVKPAAPAPAPSCLWYQWWCR